LSKEEKREGKTPRTCGNVWGQCPPEAAVAPGPVMFIQNAVVVSTLGLKENCPGKSKDVRFNANQLEKKFTGKGEKKDHEGVVGGG